MISLTPTKLRDYLTCPMLYKLRHIRKVGANATSSALAFGRSLHAALDELHRLDRESRAAIALDRLLARHWDDCYADENESRAYFAKGHEALQQYVSATARSKESTIGTEVFMSQVVTIGDSRVRFGCKADRIALLPDGSLEVSDYKTNASGKLPTAESLRTDLPTFLYYVLARMSYPDHKLVRVSYLNLLTMAKVEVEYDQRQVAANKQSLISCTRTLAAADFAPRVCEACAWCSVQDHCPKFSREVDFDAVI